MAAKSAYVVAIGAEHTAVGYVIDGKSRARLEDFTDAVVDKLQQMAWRSGVRVQVDHGKIVKMSLMSLRKEIPGFQLRAEGCLSLGGIVVCERLQSGEWNFQCEIDGSQMHMGRHPHHGQSMGMMRRNPIHKIRVVAGNVRPTETGAASRRGPGVDIDVRVRLPNGKTVNGEVTLLPAVDGRPVYASWGGSPDNWVSGNLLDALTKASGGNQQVLRDWLDTIETEAAHIAGNPSNRDGFVRSNPTVGQISDWSHKKLDKYKDWYFTGSFNSDGFLIVAAPTAAAAMKVVQREFPGAQISKPEELTSKQNLTVRRNPMRRR